MYTQKKRSREALEMQTKVSLAKTHRLWIVNCFMSQNFISLICKMGQ